MNDKNNFNEIYDELKRTSIGMKIRQRRQELGLNIKETAAALGISSGQLAACEFGANEVYCDLLLSLSKILQTNVDYFFEDLKKFKSLH